MKKSKIKSKNDLICSECGKNCGSTPGAKGMLQLHRKAKHSEIFYKNFWRKS